MTDSAELQQWRNEVRDFVRQHLPRELARKVELGLKLQKEDYVCWQKILYAHGWFAGACRLVGGLPNAQWRTTMPGSPSSSRRR